MPSNQEIAQELRALAEQVESMKPTVIAYPSEHAAWWEKLKAKLAIMSKGSIKSSNTLTMAEESGKRQAVGYIYELMEEMEKGDNL